MKNLIFLLFILLSFNLYASSPRYLVGKTVLADSGSANNPTYGFYGTGVGGNGMYYANEVLNFGLDSSCVFSMTGKSLFRPDTLKIGITNNKNILNIGIPGGAFLINYHVNLGLGSGSGLCISASQGAPTYWNDEYTDLYIYNSSLYEKNSTVWARSQNANANLILTSGGSSSDTSEVIFGSELDTVGAKIFTLGSTPNHLRLKSDDLTLAIGDDITYNAAGNYVLSTDGIIGLFSGDYFKVVASNINVNSSTGAITENVVHKSLTVTYDMTSLTNDSTKIVPNAFGADAVIDSVYLEGYVDDQYAILFTLPKGGGTATLIDSCQNSTDGQDRYYTTITSLASTAWGKNTTLYIEKTGTDTELTIQVFFHYIEQKGS